MDCGSTILICLAFIQATCGQSVNLAGPSAIERESNTVYTCTRGGEAPHTFIWIDLIEGAGDTGLNIFVAGNSAINPSLYPKYDNFDVTENGDTSTMTISNTQIEDEGRYRCTEGAEGDNAELTVEVQSTRTVSPEILVKSNINDMFEATCEAVGGRPEETITWMLGDGTIPCDDPGAVDPTPGPGLSSKRSDCTFQATSENNGQTLKCVISGHNVSSLNGEVTTTLETHTSPSDASTIVSAVYVTQGTGITVSCTAENPPTPAMRNFYIFSNGTLIHDSMEGVNTVSVSDPEEGTQYTCIAGNYLGNTTLSAAVTYDPSSTTTPPPVTALETTTLMEVGSGGNGTAEPSANVAAIAGGVVGAIVVIVIIVIAVCYCKKEERFCFEAGGAKSSGSSKPAGSAVGSSNGSEREKTKPEAAPRGHGSIQHTNDNPNQDMYAMVDKKPSGGRGGDAPDRGSGPGQNEPQGMLYADLDLSHKAGHTDKHVPKNENDVVVYSSILV